MLYVPKCKCWWVLQHLSDLLTTLQAVFLVLASKFEMMRRDFGPREDRQKTRLMWLVEDMGVDKFRDTIAEYMGDTLRPAVHEQVECLSGQLQTAPMVHQPVCSTTADSGAACGSRAHLQKAPLYAWLGGSQRI